MFTTIWQVSVEKSNYWGKNFLFAKQVTAEILPTLSGICQSIQLFCEVVFRKPKNLKNSSSDPLLFSSALVF